MDEHGKPTPAVRQQAYEMESETEQTRRMSNLTEEAKKAAAAVKVPACQKET